MSNLFTTVPNPKAVELFTAKGTTVALGSCFVENIFAPYANLGLDITVNPFGVLYNPLSIAQTITRALCQEWFTEEDIFQDGVIWRSFHCHSSFNQESSSEFLERMNQSLSHLHEKLSTAKLLCLTFGTAFFWQLKENGFVVANCQKQPGNLFNKILADETELTEQLGKALQSIQKVNPSVTIICTVSPVRYEKGNPYLNSVSKGRLFQMIEALREEFQLHYFPAYEILLDELRDYRFYNPDMRHPSPIAIEIIQERFLHTYSSAETIRVIKELLRVNSFLSHRNTGCSQKEHLSQLHTIREKVEAIESQFEIKLPHLIKRIAEKSQTLDNV